MRAHYVIVTSNSTRKSNASYLFKFLLLANICLYLEAGAVPAMLLQISKAFHMSSGQQGLLGGIVYLSLGVAGIGSGYLLRHYDHRIVIGSAVGVNNILTLIWALTPVHYEYSATVFIMIRFFMGLTQCVLCVFLPLWTNEYAPNDKKTSWMSYLQASVPLGVMTGYVISAIVVSSTESDKCFGLLCWRWPFIIEVIIGLPFCIAIHFVPREHFNVRVKHHSSPRQDNSSPDFNSHDRMPETIYPLPFAKKDVLDDRWPTSGTLTSPMTHHQNRLSGHVYLEGDNNRPQLELRQSSGSVPCSPINENAWPSVQSASGSWDNTELFQNRIRITPPRPVDWNSREDDNTGTDGGLLKEDLKKLRRQSVGASLFNSFAVRNMMRKSSDNLIALGLESSKESNSGKSQIGLYDSNNSMSSDDLRHQVDNRRSWNRKSLQRSKLQQQHNELNAPEISLYKRTGRAQETPSYESLRDITSCYVSMEQVRSTSRRRKSGGGLTASSSNSEIYLSTSPATAGLPEVHMSMSGSPDTNQSITSVPDTGQTQSSNIQSLPTNTVKPTATPARVSPGDSESESSDEEGWPFRTISESPSNTSLLGKLHKTPWSPILELVTSPVYMYLVLAMTALYFVVTGVQFWGTSYMTVALKAPLPLVQSTFIFCSASGPTSGVVFGGWLVDKVGGYRGSRHRIVALKVCFALGLLGCVFATAVSYVQSIELFVPCLWLALFFGGSTLPACSGISVAIVPRWLRPISASLSTAIFNILGYCMSLVLSGFIMQAAMTLLAPCDSVCALVWGFRVILCWSFWSLLFLGMALRASLLHDHSRNSNIGMLGHLPKI